MLGGLLALLIVPFSKTSMQPVPQLEVSFDTLSEWEQFLNSIPFRQVPLRCLRTCICASPDYDGPFGDPTGDGMVARSLLPSDLASLTGSTRLGASASSP